MRLDQKLREMENIHSGVNHVSAKGLQHVAAKGLWRFLRIAFFMMRKGLTSKSKILMDMHLMMERGKVYGKSLRNLVFHHSKDSSNQSGFGLQEYEFSCSNSPAIFNMAKRKHHYFPTHMLHFPCIHPHQFEEKEEPNTIALPKLDESNEYFSKDCLDHKKLPALQRLSPLLSPMCRRISNSFSEDNDHQVDRHAEEFIAKFYEQLKLQNRMSLLQYQEMLDRGTS